VFGDNLDGLDRELHFAVLGEHGDHNVADNIQLCLICRRDLDENVGGVERDFRVVAVDDRGERADDLVGIKNDGVDRLVPNDAEETTKMLVRLVEGHQLLSVHLLGLVQGDEADVLRRQSLVCERALDGVEVVCTNALCHVLVNESPAVRLDNSRYEGTLPRQILVKLVLQANEGLVRGLGKLEVPKDRAGHVRPNLLCLLGHGDALHLALRDIHQPVVWRCALAPENVEVQRDSYVLV